MNKHFLLLLALPVLAAATLHAQTTAFTYQGHLMDNGASANGNYDLQFTLKDALTAGATVGTPQAISPVAAANGIFTVTLNFGASAFDGSDRWVELGVRPAGSAAAYTTLAPRQRLTSTPYAVRALQATNLTGSLSAANIPAGTITGPMIAAGTVIRTQSIAGTAQTAVANTNYAATGTSPTTFTLPATANVGDIVQVSGAGPGGWSVVPGSGQAIVAPWVAREGERYWSSVASSADGTKLVAAEQFGQIYTSTDSGVNWTARQNSGVWSAVACSADGTKLVAVEEGGDIYTSTDSGQTWSSWNEEFLDWISVASSADGTKLVVAVRDHSVDSGLLYTSTDSGNNWTAQPLAGDRRWASVASSADGTKLVAVEAGGKIYTSSDSGVNWTARESNHFWSAVASSADGTRLVAAEDGGQIYTSSNSGVSWTARENWNLWSSVASSADGTKLVAVAWNGQIYTSKDSGVNWAAQESSRKWRSVASSADGSKLVAVVLDGQIYTSPASVAGTQAQNVSLTYLGNGHWKTLTDASLPAGSVNADTLQPALNADLARLSVFQTFTGQNYFQNPTNIFKGNGGGLNSLNASELTSGTLAEARLSSNVALRGTANTFTAQQTISTSTATPLHINSTWTGGTWVNLANTSAGGRAWNLITTGPGNSEGAGKLLLRDETAGAVRMTVDPNGTVNFTPGAGTIQIRNDGGVPGLNLSGGIAPGTLRLRNAVEIFPNDAAPATSAGKLDVRNLAGNATITLLGDTGRLGIGDTNPPANLSVRSSSNPLSAGANTALFRTSDPAATIESHIHYGTTGDWYIRSAKSTGKVIIQDSGGIAGIGRIPASNRLEVEGEASKSTAGAWLANSDRRIKEDIQPVAAALDTLDKVRLVDFRYTDDYRAAHPGIADKRYLNVVAQEFAEVFPDHVKSSGEKLPDGSEILQVDTYPLTIYTAAAVQELHQETKALRAENLELRQRLAAIEQLLQKQSPPARTKGQR